MPKINTSVITDKSITKEKLNDELQKKINNIGSLSSLRTNSKDTLVNSINELFQYASDGKTLVANAITGKGVTSNGNMTFQQLATNIEKISVETLGGIRFLQGTGKAYAYLEDPDYIYIQNKDLSKDVKEDTNYLLDISKECNFQPKILMIYIPFKNSYQVRIFNYYTMVGTNPFATWGHSGSYSSGVCYTSYNLNNKPLDLSKIFVISLYAGEPGIVRAVFSGTKTFEVQTKHKDWSTNINIVNIDVPEYTEVKWFAIG